jgi:uncharacterized protein (UPF0276 family)
MPTDRIAHYHVGHYQQDTDLLIDTHANILIRYGSFHNRPISNMA